MTGSDLELLHKYVHEGCEAAFAEVVQRHVDVVYSTALRQLHAPQLAEDVCQTVFLDLARNITRLRADTVLGAWLYQVARRTAVDLIRSETRRQVREQIAYDMNTLENNSSGWEQVQPVLDDCLAELEEVDRMAILLRFLQGKSLQEVGLAIGLSDDAAQKRVSRALDKLRNVFQRRGVTVGTGALTAMLATQALQAAPVGLVSAVTTATASATLAGGGFALTTAKVITMTSFQKTLITCTILGAIGVAVYQTHQNISLQRELEGLRRQMAAPTTNQTSVAAIDAPSTNADALAYSLAQAQAEKARLTLERDAAERLARMYKELAQSRENSGITNKYPTRRHVTAALGRMLRSQFLAAENLKDKKLEELTAEERSLMLSSSARMMSDLAEITQAGAKLKQDGATESLRDPVDDLTVFTYGVLDLDERQFQQSYQLFQQLHGEAVRQNLLDDNLPQTSQDALKALNERGMAEFKHLLTPEQQKTWDGFGSQLGLFGDQGLFKAFNGKSPWESALGF